jgi:hypothetical protein
VFFDNESACPVGPARRDERNRTFRLSFAPSVPLG